MKKRLIELDGPRCLANYLIVLYHGYTVLQFCDADLAESEIWSFLTMILFTSLSALFLISGYCMALGWQKCSFVGKLKRRVFRLAIPYVAWNLIFIVLYLAAARYSSLFAQKVSNRNLCSIAGWVEQIFACPIDGPLWYIRAIFIYAVVSPVACWLLRLRCGMIAGVSLIMAWAMYSHYTGLERGLVLSFPTYSIFSYLVGMWFALSNVSLSKLANKMLACVAVVFWIGEWFLGEIAHGTVCWSIGVILGIPVWLLIGTWMASKCKGSRVYETAKDMSYFVYSSHILISPIFSHAMASVLSASFIGRFTLLVAVYFIGGVVFCYALICMLRKVFPFGARMLNGEL